jgi:hypothetical protein
LQVTLKAQTLMMTSEVEPKITIWTNNVATDTEAVIRQLWSKGNAKIKIME